MTGEWRGNLARRILWQAAKDMTPERPAWLDTEGCRLLCEEAEVNHADFVSAMKYLLKRSPAQRTVLLQNLKRQIG